MDNNWLNVCLPVISRPDVGMVSTSIYYDAGNDLVSECLRLNYSFIRNDGETDFIPGPVFLTKSEVYKRVGGLSRYDKRIGEDNVICQLLKQSGYKLIVCNKAKAYQRRRFSRSVIAKRGFTGQKASFEEQVVLPGFPWVAPFRS